MLIWISNRIGREKRSELIGAGILGILLASAGILKHVSLLLNPGLFWGRLFSERLIIVLILGGLSLFSISLYPYQRATESQRVKDV